LAEWYKAERAPNTILIYTVASDGSTPQSVLSIQCSGLETSVTIFWGQPMAGYYAQFITYTVDDSKPQSEQWRVSTDQMTLGSWGLHAIPLARRFTGKGKLSVRAINRRGIQVAAHFNLEGLDRAVGPVSQACRWPRSPVTDRNRDAAPSQRR
jgi:type VI secretion system VasI family protein